MNRRFVTVFLWAAILSSPVPAQVEHVDQLEFPPLPEFEVPEPTRVVLDNGVVVMLLEDHELPLVRVSAMIHTGSRLEPADKIGLASLTGTVMRTGGTRSMSGDELDDYLESRAAVVETFIGESSGGGSMSSLKQDFAQVLKVFGDVLRYPIFADEKLQVAKMQVMAGIARQNDSASSIVSREFPQIIYGENSPYAWHETYATVNSITGDDLVAWHQTYYHPDRIILGVVGDFQSEGALEEIKRIFGDWEKGSAPEEVEVSYDRQPAPGLYYARKDDVTQSTITMGHLGIVRNNPDYYAVQVLNEVLSGSFASRLFSSVRSQKGLAYSVYGAVGSNWDHHGLFRMTMDTKTETTGAGIEALLEEARKLSTQPPTEVEVNRAKESILNSFIFSFDSRAAILSQQMTYAYYGYPMDWLSKYREGIENVTLEQVREAARQYVHPEQFAILVVGPSEGRDRPLSDFGAVKEIDITIPEPPDAGR
ncbi:MAG: M16 family metallopeptidase [Acidobacteriota bacterium]